MADRVVLLSYGIWQSAFGGETSGVMGRPITLSGEKYTVSESCRVALGFRSRESISDTRAS